VTDYYVGPTSAGSANGSSWANRFGALNSAEDKPLVAGDRVFVGPGVYRELLTIDVSGSSGSPIVYIADLDGSHTDGVGGVVRVTGSDNDQTATRTFGVNAAVARTYRTFRGFAFDTTVNGYLSMVSCTNWIIEDCYFGPAPDNDIAISITGAGSVNHTIRRCIFLSSTGNPVTFSHTANIDNAGHVVENCLFIRGGQCVTSTRVGGITVKNCTFVGGTQAVRTVIALTTGQTITVTNCLFICTTGAAVQAITLPATNEEITENYNNFWGNSADRTQVTAGANSTAYPPLFEMPILVGGLKYPWNPFALSQWSPVRRLAGTAMSSEDIYGITRPATAAKVSWGAVQFNDLARETTTKRTGAASIKLADAGVHQMFVPVSNASTTFSCYVQWEANYAGTKPQMLVKQPGQADVTVTATGSSGAWELLTTTLTPAATPSYCVVELRSNNTGTGSIATYYDDFTAT
jgi:hypothetical protein